MNRIDDPTIPNPFGKLIDLRTEPDMDPISRALLDAELLVCEATEAAWGRRHLTITHGDSIALAASQHLFDFYGTLRDLAAQCEWVRVRGDHRYVTITVAGADADRRLTDFAAAASAANPGGWTITESAVPVLN